MRLVNNCEICAKPLVLLSEVSITDTQKLKTYKCGHSFLADIHSINGKVLDFTSVDGKFVARDYQKTGVEFIMDADFCCVIGDQMRLGKTPQSLLALKNAFLQGTKKQALILVRAANTYQWLREVKTWITNGDPLGVYMVTGTKDWIPPGFKIYVMSMDTFSRRGTCKNCNHPFHEDECVKCVKGKGSICKVCVPAGDAMSDILLKFGFDVVIVDEAHSFKNTDSNRSVALTAFLKEIERSETIQTIPFTCMMCKEQWEETVIIHTQMGDNTKRVSKSSHCPKCFSQQNQTAAAHIKVTRKCGIVMLTGTAIKNRADEYFVPLNLIAPEKFPSLHQFRQNWLIQDSRNKWSRVNPYMMDKFKDAISPYVLRREKEDVYKDLPALNRIFTVIEVSDERLKKAYNKVLDTIEENMHSKFDMFSNIGELQQLRQICGMAKVPFIADYAETFVSDNERSKVAIGVHHHSVRDTLAEVLSTYGCFKLSGEDSPERKDRIMRQFETSPEQILVIGMLAGGVGMDFHYCKNVLIAERQWNSADEEQFEFRFYNPDPSFNIGTGSTTVEYILAKGTIDQFFHEMVEEKRAIFGDTIANNWSLESDKNSFKELMERTVASRL